jgi:hypothetical protein
VNPRNGVIETLYDMSIDNREHNPIVMTQRGSNFYVGTFGEEGGRSELAVFDRHFSAYTLPFKSRDPIGPSPPTWSSSIAGLAGARRC